MVAGDSSAESQAPDAPARLTCHKVTPQTYNRYVRKIDRIERLNGIDTKRRHRATKRVCKHPFFDRLKVRLAALCRPHHLVTGRVSIFDDAQTASGIPASSAEGLAVNLRPGTDYGWKLPGRLGWMHRSPKLLVKLGGRQRITRAIDLGPAGSTGRALDFSAPLAAAMGFPTDLTFPTDSIGRLYEIYRGCV